MSTAAEVASRYVHTVRHFRPSQVAHRLRLRAQQAAVARWPRPLAACWRVAVAPRVGWPAGFSPIDARLGASGALTESAERIRAGEPRFLGVTRSLGQPPDWNQASAPRLWRFHLHYFEWGWGFADHAERAWERQSFARLWGSWRAAIPFGHTDAWAPYAASLRAWALCGLFEPLIAGADSEAAYVEDLALHAGFVRRFLERDLGGNHLVKDLKALVGLGIFLGDRNAAVEALDRLDAELGAQILDDGGHFERSPSYHCQVLGDLLDVGALLAAAGLPRRPQLDRAIDAMRAWLGAMLVPDGDVPLFNDCTLVGHGRLALLEPHAAPPARLRVLRPSGYVVARPDDRLHLVADVGPPGPRELPAHAHAGWGSFELSVDGQRVIVDTGTSTYEAGARRDHERSTAAHNTVSVDGANQTEVWGAFRAARRAVPVLERAADDGRSIVVQASHDGYRRLRGKPRHRRSWRVSPGQVELVDEVSGRGAHELTAHLYGAPGVPITQDGVGWRVGPLSVQIDGAQARVEGAAVATGFGVPAHSACLAYTVTGLLPLTVRTTITIATATSHTTSHKT